MPRVAVGSEMPTREAECPTDTIGRSQRTENTRDAAAADRRRPATRTRSEPISSRSLFAVSTAPLAVSLDTLEEEVEPRLPVAVGPDRVEEPVVLVPVLA